jgi:hypothetical protein
MSGERLRREERSSLRPRKTEKMMVKLRMKAKTRRFSAKDLGRK